MITLKKLTILALHLGYGGIENCIASLANNLCNEYDVNIVSTYKLYDKPVYEIDDKVKIKYLINDDLALRVDSYKRMLQKGNYVSVVKAVFKDYIKTFHFLRLIRDVFKSIKMVIDKKRLMSKYLKKCNSDIIVSTRDSLNDLVSKYISSKTLKIAWEHNHHHGDIEYSNNLVRTCRNMDILVLVSDSLRTFYKKEMKNKEYKCKCVFIPNALDKIPSDISKLNNKNIISVGRLSREKGYDDLIEVFKLIHDKDKSTHLDIIGDGAQKNMVIDKIYQYKLTDSVTMHGFKKKNEINELLNNSSLYLMCSYTESFGIVLIESMSNGVPCIAFSSAEGANELITNDYNGYLIEDRDLKKMADKSLELLKDKKKLKELGKNGKEFSNKYTPDIIKKEWVKLLKRG